MTAILLALGAAITYGAADFLGGLATRRLNALSVVLISQVVGLAIVGAVLPFTEADDPSQGLVWGAGAGVAGAIGVILLYRGLARGRMSIIAPITAVEAAAVPVIFALITRERPGTAALVGIGLALVAVTLISSSASEPGQDEETVAGDRAAASGLMEAFGAGVSFGVFFILLDNTGDSSGVWPLVGTKVTSVAIVALLLVVKRMPARPDRSLLRVIAWAGVLDMTANLLILLAVREGRLSIVAVLTAMYPASTVLLARIHLKERLARAQLAGLGLAMVSVVLIAGA